MPLTKEKKQDIIKKLGESIDKQKSMVFVSIKGLKAPDLLDLRDKLKESNCKLSVAKKTLMNIALKDKNINVEMDKLDGEIALIFGFEDEILPAKTAYEFSKTNENLKILAGYFEDSFREMNEIITLAKIPSKKELLAKVVGSISAPISGFANVLHGNLRNLVYVLKEIK